MNSLKKVLIGSVVAGGLALVAPVNAGVFTESVITADTDVIAPIGGGLQQSVNVNGTTGPQAVNGVSFADGTLGGTANSSATALPGGLSAGFQNVLTENEFNWTSPLVINITGIVSGHSYALQLFAGEQGVRRILGVTANGETYEDVGAGEAGWDIGSGALAGNDPRNVAGTPPVNSGVEGPWEVLTYTYTAGSNADFSFTITDEFFNHFSAYSFVETAVPEPASMALMGLGGLLMLRRRRSA